MSATGRANIEGYLGASGSGKGVSIRRRLAELQPARLLIWDPRAEYGAQAQAAADLPALVAAVARAGPAGPFRLRYVPGPGVKLRDAFGAVCELAFRARSLVFLAEELSDVTTPSWAPPAWRQITTQGRHRGLHVLGAAQRAAMVDKAFLANATRLRVGELAYRPDRVAMAQELDVSIDALQALQSVERPGGGADMVLLERDRHRRTLERVRLTVARNGRVTERRELLTG